MSIRVSPCTHSHLGVKSKKRHLNVVVGDNRGHYKIKVDASRLLWSDDPRMATRRDPTLWNMLYAIYNGLK